MRPETEEAAATEQTEQTEGTEQTELDEGDQTEEPDEAEESDDTEELEEAAATEEAPAPKPDGSVRNEGGKVVSAPPGSHNAAMAGVQQDAAGHVDSVNTDNSSKSGTRI